MRLEMELGGERLVLDPAAISAIRYRAAYGRSVVTALAEAGTQRQAEGHLLRMVHLMLPQAGRMPLLELARLARRDRRFPAKALAAKAALLDVDDALTQAWESGSEPFDEYQVLALMTAGRMDMELIHELPIMHIVGLIGRGFALQDPDHKAYRPMTREEMQLLYPRRTRK